MISRLLSFKYTTSGVTKSIHALYLVIDPDFLLDFDHKILYSRLVINLGSYPLSKKGEIEWSLSIQKMTVYNVR